MALVGDFKQGKLDIHRFALIVLIPKENNAKDMKSFRPVKSK